ncbi:MAG TPA: GAK system XXXCH domain-containing protein [Desulfobacterales bacterium]
MKASERKIKQFMPPAAVAQYLRHLADALDGKTARLPSELRTLPEPIAKMEVKGKARKGRWELKIKIKAESSAGLEKSDLTGKRVPSQAAAGTDESKNEYKKLKKRIKSAFTAIEESLAAQQLPEPQVLREFLTDSDQMMRFSGERFGEACYPAYRAGCRRLSEAYASEILDDFKAAYAELDRLKKDCHKAFK